MSRARIHCPGCHALLRIPGDRLFGKCPHCRARVSFDVDPEPAPLLSTRILLVVGGSLVLAISLVAAVLLWSSPRPVPVQSTPEPVASTPVIVPGQPVASTAGSRSVGPAPVPVPEKSRPGAKKFAILVGITEYQHAQLSRLEFTQNDVEELAAVLKQPGAAFDEVHLLTVERGKKQSDQQPTTENILKVINEVLDRVSRQDTVLVALSGHGVQLEVEDPDGKGPQRKFPCFCPVDADFRGVSYSTGKSKRLINLNDLVANLGASRAGSKLVLIDACRNDVKADQSTRNADVNSISIPDGVSVLFSCYTGQRAWESRKLGKGHGIFFYHILEGLRGKAASTTGEVTWNSLDDHVKFHVPTTVSRLIGGGAKQTPHGLNNSHSRIVLVAREEPRRFEPPPPLPRPPVPSFTPATPPVQAKSKRFEEEDPKTKPKLVVRIQEPLPVVIKGESMTNSLGMQLRRIKPGRFHMGAPRSESGSKDWERPVREVRLRQEFYMGVHEVTQGEYESLMGKNPSWFRAQGKGSDLVKGIDTQRLPVEQVTWQEAVTFCRRLSNRPMELAALCVYRLPTEAEWEYACRAGSQTATAFGASLSSKQANFDGERPYLTVKGTSHNRTREVGSYPPNAWGLCDMHGNVWEWCSDWYDPRAYSSGQPDDPAGPGSGDERVMRGGSWMHSGTTCRSAMRSKEPGGWAEKTIGFRVVCVVGK